jgi:hypothetical protein
VSVSAVGRAFGVGRGAGGTEQAGRTGSVGIWSAAGLFGRWRRIKGSPDEKGVTGGRYPAVLAIVSVVVPVCLFTERTRQCPDTGH